MKVLIQGKLPEDEAYRGSCRHCKTLVEFSRAEAEFIDDHRDGCLLRVKCPTCYRHIHAPLRGRLYGGTR